MAESLIEHHAGGRRQFIHSSGAVIRFDRIEPRRGGIYAWVELHVDGQDLPVKYGNYNLMGPRTVSLLTEKLARSDGPPWNDIVSDAVLRVVRSQFEGPLPVRLSDVEASGSTRWLIRPLVEEGGPTLLVAAGGSAKSYFALATAVSVATGSQVVGGLTPTLTGPVLYLDWEADAEEHAHRLRRICAGAELDPNKVDVYYRRELQPLTRTVYQMTQLCAELDIVFIVVDSVMLARGGDAYGPEETINLFAAVREIGRPSLLADHKSREAIDKGKRGAYGSVVGENSARRIWEIRSGFDEPGRKTIRLENTKANNSALHDPLAFTFEWTNKPAPSVSIEQVSAKGILPARSAGDTPLKQTIHGILAESASPLTVTALADQLHSAGVAAKEGTIRVILNRYSDQFENVGSRAEGLWTLSSLSSDQDMFAGDL